MDTWLAKQLITIDVMIPNTTGVSNGSVPSREVPANVFCLIGSSLFTKLLFFSAILFPIIWYSSGAYTVVRYVFQLKPDAAGQILKSGLRNNSEKTVAFKHE